MVSDSVKKLLVYLLCVLIALLVAGAYGALHNQISYTVSPEYFTLFKFDQFGLSESSLPERVTAAIVGFRASWWMGYPIGMIAGLAGFFQRDPRAMLSISVRAMMVAVLFTLLFGLAGLAYGFAQTASINAEDYRAWYVPFGVTSLRRFLCASYMHNSAYLGGVLSIPLAWAYQIFRRNQSPSKLDSCT